MGLLRVRHLFGPNGAIPICKTDGFKNYILHSEDDPDIPGTNPPVKRLRLIPLGERARAADTDEVAVVVEALKRQRDERRQAAEPQRQRMIAIRERGKEKREKILKLIRRHPGKSDDAIAAMADADSAAVAKVRQKLEAT